jgi:hypothetical protein
MMHENINKNYFFDKYVKMTKDLVSNTNILNIRLLSFQVLNSIFK